MKKSKLIFNILFTLNIIGILSLFLGNRILPSGNSFPLIGLGILLILSIPLFISSIYEIVKNKKQIILPIIGIVISLFSLLLVYLIIMAIKNFT